MRHPIDLHNQEVAKMCRRFGARRLDVLGSTARGDFDPAPSDLDFLVEFDDIPPAQDAEAYFSR